MELKQFLSVKTLMCAFSLFLPIFILHSEMNLGTGVLMYSQKKAF